MLGLAAGVALAAIELGGPSASGSLPQQAVARVGQRLILRDEWLRAVAAAVAERKTELTREQQAQILQRLIDEELLVQHGLDLGLVQSDQRLRGQLVSEVVFAATAARSEKEPDESELRRFYSAQEELFQTSARVRLAVWQINAEGQRSALPDMIPDALLPPAKIQNYLGSEIARLATTLPVQAESETLSLDDRKVVITILERQDAISPSFESVRDLVRAEWLRRSDEAAVRELLAELHQTYEVQVEPLP